MHDTNECHKYGKDGTPKIDFAWRKPCIQSRGSKTTHDSSSAYAQLSAKFNKLEKSNQTLKQAQKKRKHSHESDSKDSNSSWRIGYSSTGDPMLKCKKHKGKKRNLPQSH